MHLQIIIAEGWLWFCILLAVVITTTIIMTLQGRQFFTNDGTVRAFSIMDIELAASARELKNIIAGIYALPETQKRKTIGALRGQLIVDFIFMPAAYGAIFILCMMVSNKMTSYGKYVFPALAWLQVIPWICDIIENLYLLNKIKPAVQESTKAMHRFYQLLQILKWGLSLTAAVCALAALFYFWLSGNYSTERLPYLAVIALEGLAFFIIVKWVMGKPVETKEAKS